MKQYILGLAAIMIAIAGVAFTSPAPKAKAGTHTFYFNNATYSQFNVESRSQWAMGSSPISCSPNLNEKACELEVDDAYVNIAAGTLKPTLTIVAAQNGSTGEYYVQSATSSTIHNRPR